MVFNPVFPFWLTFLIVFILFMILLWLEWNRKYRFRVLRIAAVILIAISLLAILLKPSYKVKKSSSIVLLTAGYSNEKADSILLHDPHSVLIHLKDAKPFKSSKGLDEHELIQHAREIKTVLGDGIPSTVLDRMDSVSFEYIPGELAEGVTSMFLQDQNVAGRKTSIRGIFNLGGKGHRWMYLLGPGGREDSTRLEKEGFNSFQLSFTPRRDGAFMYSLLIEDSVNGYREPIPITVQKPEALNILFLQSYPTFETQTLKNFLEHKHHKIIVRSQVSKNNFRYEYINRERVPANRLSSDLLGAMDLVIADEPALSTLMPAEKNNLIKSVQSGLGLLNLFGSSNKKESIFFPFQIKMVKKDTASIRVGSQAFTLPVSSVNVTPNTTLVPLQKNKSGILSGYTFAGAGKIGLQLLRETYQLSLSGDSVAYGTLWTPLIESLARTKNQSSKIRITTPFPWYEDEPIGIEIISSADNISLEEDSIQLPLKEDIAVDNVWHTRTWAGKAGWHTLKSNGGVILNYYVSPSEAWKVLRLANQQRANKIHGESAHASSGEIDLVRQASPLIFYIVFILASGFIWLAPKL